MQLEMQDFLMDMWSLLIEGIRYCLLAFSRAVSTDKNNSYVDKDVSSAICKIMEDYTTGKDLTNI